MLVFTVEELAKSSGQGLGKDASKADIGKAPLDVAFVWFISCVVINVHIPLAFLPKVFTVDYYTVSLTIFLSIERDITQSAWYLFERTITYY